MIRISEIEAITKHIIFQREVFVDLLDFIKVIEFNVDNNIIMDSCIITPYYIQNNKRLELYQYEFFVSDEYDFEDYIMMKTGKKLKDVSSEIMTLRKICFAKVDEKKS